MQHPIETVVLALSSGQHEERRRTEYQGDHPISLIETEGKPQKVVRTLARCLTSRVPSASTTSQLCSYPQEKGELMKHFRVLFLASCPLLLTLPAVGELPMGSAATHCSALLQCTANSNAATSWPVTKWAMDSWTSSFLTGFAGHSSPLVTEIFQIRKGKNRRRTENKTSPAGTGFSSSNQIWQ